MASDGDDLDRLYGAAWASCPNREDAEGLVQASYAHVFAKPRMLGDDEDLDHLLGVLRAASADRAGSGEAVGEPMAAPASLREWIAAERDRTLIRRMVVKRMKLTGLLAGGAAVLGVVVGLISL